MSFNDELKKLEQEFPAYQVWYIPKVIGPTLWCARVWETGKPVIRANSTDLLREGIREHEKQQTAVD